MIAIPSTEFEPLTVLIGIFTSTTDLSSDDDDISSIPDFTDASLPDAVRVLGTLDEANGTMWQEEIRQNLEWSASKTSRKLSELEDDGNIRRHQIGRRKVVCLPGCEPPLVE